MALSDREKWILGVAGSLATLGIGYLIWRHENAVSQSEAAANAAAQQQNDADYANQLEQALSVGGGTQASQSLGGGGGYIGADTTNGSTIDSTGGTGGDSNLASILAAFFPQGTSSTTNNGSASGGSNTTPAPPEPTLPPSTPQPLPVSGGEGTVNDPLPGGSPIGIRPTGGPQVPIASHNLVQLGTTLVQ